MMKFILVSNSCSGKNCPKFDEAIKPFEPKSECLVDVGETFAELQAQTLLIKDEINNRVKTLINSLKAQERRPRAFAGEAQCPYCVMTSLGGLGASRDECDEIEDYKDCKTQQSCGSGKLELILAGSNYKDGLGHKLVFLHLVSSLKESAYVSIGFSGSDKFNDGLHTLCGMQFGCGKSPVCLMTFSNVTF